MGCDLYWEHAQGLTTNRGLAQACHPRHGNHGYENPLHVYKTIHNYCVVFDDRTLVNMMPNTTKTKVGLPKPWPVAFELEVENQQQVWSSGY